MVSRFLPITFLFAGAASAALPPPPGCCAEAGWDGPGLLCESAFTLRVAPDEYVREDVQLEPWQPSSNTVKSPRGWYSITVVDGRSQRPRRRDRLRLLRETQLGRLFEYAAADQHDAARFVHVPRRGSRPWLEVTFWKATRADSSDWRQSPQVTYSAERYDDVLERIGFEGACPPNCLSTDRVPRGCGAEEPNR